ncbi:hypothetical protein CMI42_06205 [Candidatus Pacearchaeota archaeon]|nr:hypothetical protein [Candidatus Pacearchaeota archaeon]
MVKNKDYDFEEEPVSGSKRAPDEDERTRSRLEIADLSDFLAEHGEHILNDNDLAYINGMISRRESFLSGRGSTEDHDLYNSDETQSEEILRVIKTHAEDHRAHKRTAYSVNGEMIPESEFYETLKGISRKKGDLKGPRDKEILSRAMRALYEGNTLSARQTRSLEKMISGLEEAKKKIDSGYIYLTGSEQYSTNIPELGFIKNIVNLGVYGKKSPSAPPDEKIAGFWESYFGPNRDKDYDELLAEYGRDDKRFKRAAEMLKIFMEKVDLDIHKFRGLARAIPRDL